MLKGRVVPDGLQRREDGGGLYIIYEFSQYRQASGISNSLIRYNIYLPYQSLHSCT